MRRVEADSLGTTLKLSSGWCLFSPPRGSSRDDSHGLGPQVSPTFHFDLDRISFGVVSYGFLNSKTLTLTNTSEASPSQRESKSRDDKEKSNGKVL